LIPKAPWCFCLWPDKITKKERKSQSNFHLLLAPAACGSDSFLLLPFYFLLTSRVFLPFLHFLTLFDAFSHFFSLFLLPILPIHPNQIPF